MTLTPIKSQQELIEGFIAFFQDRKKFKRKSNTAPQDTQPHTRAKTQTPNTHTHGKHTGENNTKTASLKRLVET